MNKKIGFIGCGNMAKAIIGGLIKSELVLPSDIIASAASEKNLNIVKESYGISTSTNNIDAAKFSDILILAVKPNMYASVIEEIKEYIKDDPIVVTIAAGITIDSVEKNFGKKLKVVRTMPNTPALVGEGMSALCANDLVTEDELKIVLSIFESFGKTEVINEKLMDAIPAISGSSPAYIYILIEALADGGVMQGIPRDKAYKLAAQSVLGSAKMVLETGIHPGALKDNVCSPGGTTIDAVATLEEKGFRSAIISAMQSCTKKAIEMSKKN
ncbi:pyrroline-5-carboxylate reductase [Clostridium sp. DJ247]|uniref:pyrroline-5-carboxylate reductase n=1 Tax=Clostridium sp. DJ247 TaxID=2726188 RepID=UPI001627E536|nr:pyrroline-5-carboxylate reductase [Clostridium sp. DJ247]MBC2582410.1 pyrroline-5-carboxylate reductase [Clostridium sp. DJ247]